MITFSYCIDAAGNLVKLMLGEHCDALIPGSVELVSSAAELSHPLPWTKSIADAVNEIRFVPYPHVVGTAAQQVHENRKLPHAPYVFVPPQSESAPEQHVLELIDLYDEVPAGHIGRLEIEEALRNAGIQLIPLLENYHSELHAGTPTIVSGAYIRPGWISHRKVYRKAQIS